jgi:hypothetical protein
LVDEGIIELGTAAAVELAASELAARSGAETRRCANCRTSLVGPYCALCGQAVDVHRHGIWKLLHDVAENIFSFDSRIMRTFVALLFAPGELSIAFREGRTQRFVPALRLYLFVSLIFFVLMSISNIAIMQFEVTIEKSPDPAKASAIVNDAMREGMDARDRAEVEAAIKQARERAEILRVEGKPNEHFSTKVHFFAPIGTVQSKLTPQQREQLMKQLQEPPKPVNPRPDQSQLELKLDAQLFHAMRVLATDPAALNGPLTTWIPRVLFLLLPIYALLMALFYVRKRKKFYVIDHFVFSLNFHSFAFALLTIAVFTAQVIETEWLGWTALALLAVYGLIAMKRFYRQNWFWTSFKYLIVSFIYLFFILGPALGLVLVVAMTDI